MTERCWETNRNRQRCKLPDGHLEPCDFQGDERRRREAERQRRRNLNRKSCPTCLRVHPGPRCVPEEDKRVKVTLYLDPRLMERFDEAVGHYGWGKDRRQAIEQAMLSWLEHRDDGGEER